MSQETLVAEDFGIVITAETMVRLEVSDYRLYACPFAGWLVLLLFLVLAHRVSLSWCCPTVSACFEQIGRIAGEGVAGYDETEMWTRCRTFSKITSRPNGSYVIFESKGSLLALPSPSNVMENKEMLIWHKQT